MRKNILLHVSIVHSDRASSDFGAIQHKIVMLSSNLGNQEPTQGPGRLPRESCTNLVDATVIHSLDILPHGGGKWMVGASPSAMCQEVLVWIRPSEKGELSYP